MEAAAPHKARTLWFAGILHCFTHIYHVAIMPLYLHIQRDFGLASVGTATLLVTIMMAAYFLPSYAMGVLADRVNRKKLLTIGLILNGLGFVGLGLAPNYGWALASVILAGFGGSFFHPAATAMIARLYPVGTGRALGLFGVGASVGFFIGPIYAGWRAEMSSWRAPMLELGTLGIIAAILFARFADEEKPEIGVRDDRLKPALQHTGIFPTAALWGIFIFACFAFGLRDFAGSSMGTVGSLFLQQAHGFSIRDTGLALSAILVASALSNPWFGSRSDQGRFRWAAFVLLSAALVMAIFPRLPVPLLVPAYLVYGFFFMASYPIIEAALMESVPDRVRGRVFGLFITGGGFLGNLAHWVIGKWVEQIGPAANVPHGFYPIYGALALLIVASLAGLPALRAIGRREQLRSESVGQGSRQALISTT